MNFYEFILEVISSPASTFGFFLLGVLTIMFVHVVLHKITIIIKGWPPDNIERYKKLYRGIKKNNPNSKPEDPEN